MKKIVVPGEVVSEKPVRLDNTYVYEGKTVSKILGMYDDSKGSFVSLEGAWRPRVGNSVIGIVASVGKNACIVDLNHSTGGVLLISRSSSYEPKVGDVIESVVKEIERKNTAVMDRARQLKDGIIIPVKPAKVPRVRGRADSMITQIEELTGTRIKVGTNGMAWIKGRNVSLAVDAIRKIEREAHTSGLTDKIKQMLESRQED